MEQTRRYRIRSLVIPLLIHWGISNIVSMGVMMYIMGGMWSTIANGTMEIADATTKIMNELMGYMTEITTLSAVIAVPVFYYIFHKDRKKDILYNVKDRQKAESIGSAIKMRFPDQPVYVHFYSPRWICRVGNFRSYAAANQLLKKIRAMGYRSACLVKGKITVQK